MAVSNRRPSGDGAARARRVREHGQLAAPSGERAERDDDDD